MAPGRLKASVPPEHVTVSLGNKKGSVGCSLDIHERVSLNLDWLSDPFPESQSPSSPSASSSKPAFSPRPGNPSPMSITSDVPERVAVSLGMQNKNKWEAPRAPQVLLVEVERPGEEGNRLVTVTIDRNEEEETQYRGGFRDVRDGNELVINCLWLHYMVNEGTTSFNLLWWCLDSLYLSLSRHDLYSIFLSQTTLSKLHHPDDNLCMAELPLKLSFHYPLRRA